MSVTTEWPYCHVLTPHLKPERCDQCFTNRSDTDLKRCSRCKTVRYCSTKCQKMAWTLHKDECQALKRIAPKIPTDSVLLMLRLLILRKNGQDSVKQKSAFGERCFQDLMSHTKEIKGDSRRMEEFSRVIGTLQIYADGTIELPSAAELLEIFGKVCVNSFTICDHEMQSLGVGIYLGASHLDHSCSPNAVPSFCGVELQIARTDGSIFENSPTLISYTEQLCTTAERRQELRERYYFSCHCSRCQDMQQDEEKLQTLCPVLNCTGRIRQNNEGEFRACSGCGKTEFGSDYALRKTAVVTDIQQTLDKLKNLRKARDFTEMLTGSKAGLYKYRGFLPANNTWRCRLEDQAFDACIELSLWDEAVQFGQNTLHCYRTFYDQFHPNLGIQLMKIGKILLFLGQLHDALRHLQEAESVLSVTHRGQHPLYKDLSGLLDQCAEERRVQLDVTQYNS